MTKDKEPIDFFDAEGNRIGTLDASAPLVMDWQRGNRIGTLDATTPKNEFNPDWNQMVVLVEQSQEQAAKIEQLEKQLAVQTYAADNYRRLLDESDHAYAELREKLAEPMTEVADRFAHRMALELECVLSDGAYSNKWYKSAMQVLSEYRSAMNAIHEQHSPTFMGEPALTTRAIKAAHGIKEEP